MIQVFQVILFFIGGIIVISIIINKSPATLFAGLGASAAILMLVFKDTILGFVAGIQLSANDMVHVGDWISMPSANANGIVKEIPSFASDELHSHYNSVRIVYNCAGNWEDYANYTSALTNLRDLKLGWR